MNKYVGKAIAIGIVTLITAGLGWSIYIGITSGELKGQRVKHIRDAALDKIEDKVYKR